MKKVELHLHLDGSLNLDYASKLAGRDVSCEMISKDDTSLTEYLKKFSLPGELFQDYDNIVEFSYLLGKELEKDDVIYAEIRFCPLFHINNNYKYYKWLIYARDVLQKEELLDLSE